MPYGYYQLLRFVVCAAFAVLAYAAYKADRSSIYWIWLAALAVVYNPIARSISSAICGRGSTCWRWLHCSLIFLFVEKQPRLKRSAMRYDLI